VALLTALLKLIARIHNCHRLLLPGSYYRNGGDFAPPPKAPIRIADL
jgi:hypothetical protein